MKRIIIIIILSLATFMVYGRNSSIPDIPDSIRGMFIADSISETRLKEDFFCKYLKKLRRKLKGKESVVIRDFDLKEFIAVIDDMGQFGIIKNPHSNLTITKDQYNTIYNWFKKVSPYITRSMTKNFIKINYMAFCSDYEIEKLERLLSQYRKILMSHYQDE